MVLFKQDFLEIKFLHEDQATRGNFQIYYFWKVYNLNHKNFAVYISDKDKFV